MAKEVGEKVEPLCTVPESLNDAKNCGSSPENEMTQNDPVTQQFHFCMFIQKNWEQGLQRDIVQWRSQDSLNS